jgi:ketosteroid isomerase-like protein
VEWEGIYGGEGKVPHAGLRRGKDGVREFFSTLGQHVEFEQFEPRQFVSTGGMVVALGTYRAKVKTTGRGFASDWAMQFRVQDGKIAFFREYTNNAGVIAAFA